jgi:tellurite resistance protein TerA
MELAMKGNKALVPAFQMLIMKAMWQSNRDFDIAAAYEKKDGEKGIVYFGTPERGSLTEFPYIQIDQDGGQGGNSNDEALRICSIADMAKIHLFIWDYESITSGGTPGQFSDAGIILKATDDNQNEHQLNLDSTGMGNVCCLGTIDNTSEMGVQLINKSNVSTWKGLDSDDFFALAEM